MKNSLGVSLPEYIEGYGEVKPFNGVNQKPTDSIMENSRDVTCVLPGENKLLESIDEALVKCNISDGMTVSFHHHLRNGDYVLNFVMEAIAERNIHDITIVASSIFPIHEPLVEHIRNGVVTKIVSSYISGAVGESISRGELKYPAAMQTHGGRARAIEAGEVNIDIAFIAAPCCDNYGNINGVNGPSACGALGYAIADAQYGKKVVAITDNLVPYPACPIEIPQSNVDYVIKVDSIGNPKGIVSGTTQITKEPIGLIIAANTAEAIKASGYFKEGFSFQTGAGGISLAVAEELKYMMREKEIKGSFASGGITGYLVDMLEEGLFKSLFDVQCFDLEAVESYGKNKNHQPMSASLYGNPYSKGAIVNNLDIVILGATEIDVNFNVNVTTGSNGVIMGGSGGHSDTAAGAKLTIIVSNLMKARLPIIKDRVTTITTPGETIDLLVTERGIAVNPCRKELKERLIKAGLNVKSIEELKAIAEGFTGVPKHIEFKDKIVGVIEYRDGTVLDLIKMPKHNW